jgi:hypothetical protein
MFLESQGGVQMRILVCALWVLPAFIVAQEKDSWRRIYTYDDSVIEMNTARVTFGAGNIGRVRFRTVWSKPAALTEKPGVKYKSRLETIEFKCVENRYRIYETTLLDPKGKTIESSEVDVSEEWKPVKPGGMMRRLFGPACQLIDEKRRHP